MGEGATLQARALGWPRVAALGVAVAIAGQFSGWNYGLTAGGWGGLMLAAALTATFYWGFVQCVAELAAAMPSAGGFETYCRLAFGEGVGYLAGASVLVALAIAIGVVANFFAAYARALLGVSALPLKAALFATVLFFQLRGAREAGSVTLAVAAVAVAALLLFSASMAPFATARNLLSDGTSWFPHGARGVFYSIPFALWMFLGLEQAALAAEETADPVRAMPKALAVAFSTLLGVALAVLVLGPAGGGVEQIRSADDPLYAALTSSVAYGRDTPLTTIIGVGVLTGLAATFFSVVYASSRQLYSLAREGYLPQWLAATNRRQAPHAALLAVCAVGLAAGLAPPDQSMLLVIFLLTASYICVLVSFIRLRGRQPELARPYRALGGMMTAGTTLVLGLLVLLACLAQQSAGMLYGLALYAILSLQFLLGRHRKQARSRRGA